MTRLFFTLFAHASALDNGLILTPPMGFSTWNKFRCGISESLTRGVADALVSSGMRDAGYTHLNLDDCWMDKSRTADGKLQGDLMNFPSGMKTLGDYIHSKSLLYGLYLDPGTMTCQRRPGSYQHEQDDADYLAAVGADYLKHDACYSTPEQQLHVYFDMRDALNKSGRAIGYSICPNSARCNDPSQVMWDASSVANVNMCRGDAICRDYGLADRPRELLGGRPNDIVPTWHSWLCMLDVQAQFDSMRYAGPGHFVMPDMLEVTVASHTRAICSARAGQHTLCFARWATA
jgi:alpha-galactosidase